MMVVLESLAQGTPVISTKTTPWKSLEDFNCGYWVNKDVDSIKTAIDNFLSKSEYERKEMSINSMKLAKEFSADKLAGKYLQMYESILKPKE